ncbi:hypothetical protein ACVWWJ_003441 [Luteibacter sp. HA06]
MASRISTGSSLAMRSVFKDASASPAMLRFSTLPDDFFREHQLIQSDFILANSNLPAQ